MSAGQLDFGFRTPKRKRKPRRGRPPSTRAGVPHRPRTVPPKCPLHITLRMRREVYQLRSRRCFRVLHTAFLKASARFDSRIVHFSVQHNHVHILVETSDARTLARAMQGLAIRMARGLNRVMGRKNGTVFADRYHSRTLRTPSEVRAALVYVLNNVKKHQDGEFSAGFLDPFSSAAHFDGWVDPPMRPPEPAPVAPARTWLLQSGWLQRGGGRIRRNEVPRS